MWVAASQSILTANFAMHVAGALVIIVQLLAHLRSPLILTLRILRNLSAASAIVYSLNLFVIGFSLFYPICTYM